MSSGDEIMGRTMKFQGLSRPQVNAVQLIRRFSNENIRRKAFEFEDALKGLIDAQPNFLPENPAAGPEAPRFTITDGKRLFVASNVSAQLQLDFGAGVPKGGLVEALAKTCRSLDEAYAKVLEDQVTYYSGLIVLLHFETKGPQDFGPILPIVQQLLRVPTDDPITAFDGNIGRRRGDINYTIGFSQYAVYSRRIEGLVPNQQFFLDGDFDAPDQGGLQLKVDINTKPRRSAPQKSDFEVLRNELTKAFDLDVKPLLGDLVEGIV